MKTTVIYNPVDVSSIRALARIPLFQDGSLANWSNANIPYALYIGTREGCKNFREIMTLMRADTDIHLLVVGPPPYAAELCFLQHHLSRIHFLGRLPDTKLFPLFARSQFLFFPSLYEGFGMPLVEASALGVPVVGLDTPVNNEISGGTVVSFRSGDVEDLRRALTLVSRVPPLVRDDFLANFNPDRVALHYANLFRGTPLR